MCSNDLSTFTSTSTNFVFFFLLCFLGAFNCQDHRASSTSIPALKKTIIPAQFIETSKVYNCESTWSIQNFRLLHGISLITEQTFSPKDIKYEWFLLYNGEDSSSLNLGLKPSDKTIKEFGGASGEIEFALIGAYGEKRYVKKKLFSMLKTNYEVFDEFIKKTDLLDAWYTSSLLPGGTLTIYCQVSFVLCREIETTLVKAPTVENNFSRYFDNEESSDLTIKLLGKEYPAHKFVLAARSPVFKEMFERDAGENHHRDSIIIQGIDEDVFLEMLRFIYTGKVEMENLKNTKSKINLLLASYKYNIKELQNICEKESNETGTEIRIISRKQNLQESETDDVDSILRRRVIITIAMAIGALLAYGIHNINNNY